MPSVPTTTQRISLDDDAYFDPASCKNHGLAMLLFDEDFDGVVIGAPKSVALDRHQSLPLVMVRAGSYRQLYDVQLAQHGLLTIMDLTTSRLWIGPAIDTTDDDDDEDDEGPPDEDEGYVASTERIDLREHANLTWLPGKHIVTVLLRDRASNRATVELRSSSAQFRDEEAEAYIHKRRAERPTPWVSPAAGTPYPVYRDPEGALPIPEAEGIVLDLPRVVELPASETADLPRTVVSLSYRVPIRHEDVLKAEEQSQLDGATAVVPLWLLVVGTDNASAGALHINAPAYQAIEGSDEEPVACGQVAVDLMKLKPMTHPQTYMVYAFCGPVMAGPVPLALVSPQSWRR